MTNQEIFDKAFNGLKNQGFKRGTDELGICMYRSPAGLKCAVGHLIPDELYTPELENRTVREDKVRQVLEACGVGSLQIGLLTSLQDAHDCLTSRTMEDKLITVALNYNLVAPAKEST